MSYENARRSGSRSGTNNKRHENEQEADHEQIILYGSINSWGQTQVDQSPFIKETPLWLKEIQC